MMDSYTTLFRGDGTGGSSDSAGTPGMDGSISVISIGATA